MDVRRPDAGRLQCRLQQLCLMDLALVYGLHVKKCPWVLLSCFLYQLALNSSKHSVKSFTAGSNSECC